jgi:hypothetical protein
MDVPGVGTDADQVKATFAHDSAVAVKLPGTDGAENVVTGMGVERPDCAGGVPVSAAAIA